VAALLTGAGLELHEPMVGEFVTSLDMAGCSLTLFWLDDELQALHDATAITPAFTCVGPDVMGVRQRAAAVATPRPAAPETAAEHRAVADEGGVAGVMGAKVRAALAAVLAAVEVAEEELGRLDAAAGDGDHGAGMVRGFRAATAAIAGFEGTARRSLRRAGAAFTDTAGGASGALVGGWLSALGAALPEDDEAIDAAAIGAALAEGVATIERLGQAQPGDKTMLDTLVPFVQEYQVAAAGGASIADAWNAALPAGEAGMIATREMVSRRGRASRLGERSRGHQDAGATSIYYVLRGMGTVFAGE
jgi:dihydroxyacetone kinase